MTIREIAQIFLDAIGGIVFVGGAMAAIYLIGLSIENALEFL